MSLVSSGVSLKDRCTIQRDANAGTEDGWGGSESPDWQDHLTELRCRGWTEGGQEPVEDEKVATYVARKVIVPLDTDVTEADRVSTVTRRGQEIFDGPMSIEAVLRHRDHLELTLERIR